MSDAINCPVGADYEKRAPWNSDSIEDAEVIEVEVTMSVCLSKTITVKVDKDYTDLDLKKAVGYKHLTMSGMLQQAEDAVPDWLKDEYKGWHIDEYEVVKNE